MKDKLFGFSRRLLSVLLVEDVFNQDVHPSFPRVPRQKEGISSILSVPIVVGGRLIGAVRVYTGEPWEFTLDDVNFVQALAQIAGGAINMARYVKGLKSSIEVLKTMKEVQ